MRVKPASAGSEDKAKKGKKKSSTTSASDSPSPHSSDSFSMGYTGVPTAASVSSSYKQQQQAFPDFFDLLDDSPGAEDNDSPIPAHLEEEFLDLLAENSDLAMYPPPPYQGGTTYTPAAPAAQTAAAAGYQAYPNQYIPPPYQSYGNYMYQQPAQPQQPQQPQRNVPQGPIMTAAVKPEPSTTPTSQQQMDVYSKGEKLVQNLQAIKPHPDALRTIAKKVGIAGDSSENSDDGSVHSEVTAIEVLPQRRVPPLPITQQQSPNASSPNQSTTTKKSRSKSSKSSKSSSASRSPQSNRKETVTIDVPEEVLYEEAKSKPIKHRKEPDIVETKDRSVRNAINARVNRQKHKLYVDGLEQEVEDLKVAKQTLEDKHRETLERMAEMQSRIKYLENVIANDTTISSVLSSLGTVNSLRISSSIIRKRKHSADTTNHESPSSSSGPPAKIPAGVCVHIDKDNVSVEFCEKCAENAHNGRMEDE